MSAGRLLQKQTYPMATRRLAAILSHPHLRQIPMTFAARGAPACFSGRLSGGIHAVSCVIWHVFLQGKQHGGECHTWQSCLGYASVLSNAQTARYGSYVLVIIARLYLHYHGWNRRNIVCFAETLKLVLSYCCLFASVSLWQVLSQQLFWLSVLSTAVSHAIIIIRALELH